MTLQKKTDFDDPAISYMDEVTPSPQPSGRSLDALGEPWLVLLADDDEDIHLTTRLALKGVTFRNRPLRFLSAYSGHAALEIVEQTPDIALILLDVVMESDHAGLDVVKKIREDLNNRLVQIILRTGQPGQAPEEKVIVDYEINDYKSKSEITAQHLFTMVLAALRSYEQLTAIESQKRTLRLFAQAANRFVPREFLRVLQKTSIADTHLGDQTQIEMTILFLDVRSFISLTEKMSPVAAFEFINQLLDWICPIIRVNEGFIDKYLGDGVLALFPRSVDDALETVNAIRDKIAENNRHRASRGESSVHVGMGIHFGALMLGIVGEPERLEATVIGDAVNTASRIQSMTKFYGVDALVSDVAVAQLKEPKKYSLCYIEQAHLRGKIEAIGVFEVLGDAALNLPRASAARSAV